MKKKGLLSAGIVAVICILALMFTTIMASADPFKDVKEDNWFYDSVMYANDNGLMKGVSDDEFAPQMTMSRAMIVTVLHRMEGEPSAPASAFKDVPADTWYTAPVAWASANGVVNGFDANTFGPNNDVTREQIATILYRYADTSGYDMSPKADLSGFADFSKVSSWSKEALSWANAVGLIKGRDGNRLAPEANATRAEVATIFQRFCEDLKKPSGDNSDDQDDLDDPANQDPLPMPDDPSEADTYYWENSEKVISVEKAIESDRTLNETEVLDLLKDRGFSDYEVIYDYSIDGEFVDHMEAIDGKKTKAPLYQTYYVSETRITWSIFVIGNAIYAMPINYNLESTLEAELVLSETGTILGYDKETGQYYETVPKSSAAIVKKVNRIDATTLESLTIEEIDKL